MDQLLETLRNIGFSSDDIGQIKDRYQNDLDGLNGYVLIMRAMLDDRHEYIS